MFPLLLLLVPLIFGAFRAYCYLSTKVWNGEDQINIVLGSKSSVAIFSFDPAEKTIAFLFLPPETLVETTGNYGRYRATSLYPLDEMEKKGGTLFKGSLQSSLLVPLDAWVYSGKEIKKSDDPKTVIKEIRESLKESQKTNLTNWDRIRLSWQISRISEASVNILDLEKMGVFETVSLPDESKAFVINQVAVDDSLMSFFQDAKVREEDRSIAVMNSSDLAGLATAMGKIIERMGGRLVKVGDFPQQTANCQIKSELLTPKNSYTVRRLLKVFPCQWKLGTPEGYRADIVLVLNNP